MLENTRLIAISVPPVLVPVRRTPLTTVEEACANGLTMTTDGSPPDNGATGCTVVWKSGRSWAGTKTHMYYNQEAYDAECAALASAPETVSR